MYSFGYLQGGRARRVMIQLGLCTVFIMYAVSLSAEAALTLAIAMVSALHPCSVRVVVSQVNLRL